MTLYVCVVVGGVFACLRVCMFNSISRLSVKKKKRKKKSISKVCVFVCACMHTLCLSVQEPSLVQWRLMAKFCSAALTPN